ncbi:hypothetical protein C8F04DRAFT_131623 [Mycena alexandri]|uniref:NB-ARC domain-containing protein n=1 Tax=Mycena alexandri TaxID=1745969 RepID=A0AAD6SDG6_9AGAR|nr:hypothetical protein C8F04DRAFT_131623 [Mycena alexandri]
MTFQGVKSNKERWVHILERVHQLLCVLATICSADSTSSLSPSTLDAIGRLAQNLQKIQSCLRAQQELGTFKRFFKQTEILQQIDSCELEMQDILYLFKSVSEARLRVVLEEFDCNAGKCQKELFELFDRTNTSDGASSIQSSRLQGHSTSSVLSLLPPPPQIFRGREIELEAVLLTLLGDSPWVAIVGSGGVGKTTLATAALHHPDIVAKYTNRHFIQCETANSAKALIYILGSHLGLESSKSPAQDICDHLRVGSPTQTLLVFDNFETPWEPRASRGDVEGVLSMLVDIAGVAILVTMRGAERPASVKWSRPFLPQLKPLTAHAARQTFIDIADEPAGPVEDTALAGLLEATGNLPLAISLMANVASYEGYIAALSRWEAERTKLISEGNDKRSNLEKSILVSVNSHRLSATPNAKRLLGLLSILPDGTSDVELTQSGIPIPDILHIKSLLLGTSLAYLDYDGRIKVLAPIREYMNTHFPVSTSLFQPMRSYLYEMLRTWDQRRPLLANSFVPRLAVNLGNVRSVVNSGLGAEGDDLKQSILAALALDRFTLLTAREGTGLLERLPAILDHITDDVVHGKYLRSLFSSYPRLIPPGDVDRLTTKGIHHFENAQDYSGQAAFYTSLGRYHYQVGHLSTALEFNTRGLAIAKQTGDIAEQYSAIFGLCFLHAMSGHPRKAFIYSLQGHRIGRLRGDFLAEAECMGHQAFYHLRRGRFSRAVELCVQGRELLRACGLELGQPDLFLVGMQAQAYMEQSNLLEAQELYRLMKNSSSKLKAPQSHVTSLASLAYIDIILGTEELAILQNIQDGRTISAYISSPRGFLICDQAMGELHLRRGQRKEARELFERCLLQSRGRDPEVFLVCLQRLSDIHTGMTSTEDAFKWAVVFFAFANKIGDLPATYQALCLMGDGFLRNGDEITAQAIFNTVLDATTAMDLGRGRGQCMLRLGNISWRAGDLQGARELWINARPLLLAAFQTKEVGKLDLRLGTVTEISE